MKANKKSTGSQQKWFSFSNMALIVFLSVEFFYISSTLNGKVLTILSAEFVYLSHDVAVIQWITSCHKNRMTTRK